MTYSADSFTDYGIPINCPQHDLLVRVCRLIDNGDENALRRFVVDNEIDVTRLPLKYYRKPLTRYGRFITFGQFFEEYEKQLGIERKRYTDYELLKLSEIFKDGRGTRVQPNYYLSIYYLARIFYHRSKDHLIYVLDQPSPEEYKQGFLHFLKGYDMLSAEKELRRMVYAGYPQAMRPLSDVLYELDEPQEGKYWRILSNWYDPLYDDDPLSIFAAILQNRFFALETLSEISEKRTPFNMVKIREIIRLWTIRYYEQQTYQGNGLAMYRLSCYYEHSGDSQKAETCLKRAASMGCGYANKDLYWDEMNKIVADYYNTNIDDSKYGNAAYYLEAALSAGMVKLEKERKKLKTIRKKAGDRAYEAAAASPAVAAAYERYRAERDSKKSWRNLFMTGAGLTDKEMGYLGMALHDQGAVSASLVMQHMRNKDEEAYKEKLIRDQMGL